MINNIIRCILYFIIIIYIYNSCTVFNYGIIKRRRDFPSIKHDGYASDVDIPSDDELENGLEILLRDFENDTNKEATRFKEDNCTGKTHVMCREYEIHLCFTPKKKIFFAEITHGNFWMNKSKRSSKNNKLKYKFNTQ